MDAPAAVTAYVPKPGHVLRYAYLWSHEADLGLEEGRKARPCAVVLALPQGDELDVIVLPITHRPPTDTDAAIEIPPDTKRRLGLDDERSWIVLTEANRFFWPGYDLCPQPGQGLETTYLGPLPASLFQHVKDRFLAYARRQRANVLGRSD